MAVEGMEAMWWQCVVWQPCGVPDARWIFAPTMWMGRLVIGAGASGVGDGDPGVRASTSACRSALQRAKRGRAERKFSAHRRVCRLRVPFKLSLISALGGVVKFDFGRRMFWRTH